MKRFGFLFAVFFCICLSLTAQNDLSTRTIDGKSYYEYVVTPGDGLFSIARRFNVSQASLHEANANLTSDIHPGDIILIPIREQRQNKTTSGVTAYHIVEPKETLYAISRMYNIPLDTIESLNRYLALHGIHPGDTIILAHEKSSYSVTPKQQKEGMSTETQQSDNEEITHLVQKKETLYSISKQYNVAIHDILDLNPDVEKNGLKAGQMLIIKAKKEEKIIAQKPAEPIILGQKAETIVVETKEVIQNAIETIEEKVEVAANEITETPAPFEPPFAALEFPTDRAIKIAYLLPLNATKGDKNSRFAEFYKGALLAMLHAKNEGISAEVYFYDTEKNSSKIDSILSTEEIQTVDVIVGPAYSENLEQVISFARAKDIICVVPFSNKIPQEYYYPKLFQFNPPHELIFKKILTDVFEPRHLDYIFCNFRNEGIKAHNFSKQFKSILDENNVRYTSITVSEANIDSTLTSISSDSTIIILSTINASQAEPIVNKIARANLKNVELWGFEDWGESVLRSYKRTYYYSLFNGLTDRNYSAAYQKYFGKNISSGSTQYDLIGYDLTTWIMYSIAINSDASTHINRVSNDLFIQTIPNFEYQDGRYVNTSYTLFYWNGISQKRLR